jgi:hypothetical protein
VPEFAVPIMPSKDLDATLAFYERLGFENAGARPSEWNYLIIRRGTVQLHFYGDSDVDPLTTSSSCYVFTEDADALYESWNAIGIPTDPATGSRLHALSIPTTGSVSSHWSTQAGTSFAWAPHLSSDNDGTQRGTLTFSRRASTTAPG